MTHAVEEDLPCPDPIVRPNPVQCWQHCVASSTFKVKKRKVCCKDLCLCDYQQQTQPVTKKKLSCGQDCYFSEVYVVQYTKEKDVLKNSVLFVQC